MSDFRTDNPDEEKMTGTDPEQPLSVEDLEPEILEELAREVYNLLRKELRVERERIGWTSREL